MRIVNDEGAEMPWDGKATGELEVRGPHVIKGYFRVSLQLSPTNFIWHATGSWLVYFTAGHYAE